MAERLAASRAGPPTVFVNNRALHSRYDPGKEAETYLAEGEFPRRIRFFLLIEPGLGYLIPVLQRRFPGSGIIALHVSPFLAERQKELHPGAQVWAPKRGDFPERDIVEGLQDFLEQEIPDLPSAEIKIIEWRPSFEAFGGICLSLLRGAVEFLRRADANARTGAFFGRRWIKNFFRNLSLARHIAAPPSAGRDIPWIVAGAGPSLEESAGKIREIQEQYGAAILAVSAAWPALAARGIQADAVISADGGGWALFHLFETLRGAGGKRPFLAVSLTAALPSQCGKCPLLPVSDGSLWQAIVLAALGVPFLSLPARGTVAALAIDLALALGAGPVFLAGMDFSCRDIQAHARPYGLDRFHEDYADRLHPAYSGAFSRSGLMGRGGAYKLYAEWFRKQLNLWPGRIYSLGGNHPLFGDCPAEGFRRHKASPYPRPPAAGNYPDRDTLLEAGTIRRGVEALAAALEGPAGERLAGELGPLLLPEQKSPLPAALAEEIRILAAKYYG